jgi:DNA-binding transcriptional ArsR family regulator
MPAPQKQKQIDATAALFGSLADANRMTILSILHESSPQSVTALCEAMGQSRPAVSHHLLQFHALTA